MKPRKKELKALLSHIGSAYIGDYASISRDLHRAIYYLHYLEKDIIPQHEVQDTCFALHQLGECFYRAHHEQRRREHQRFRERLEKIAELLSG